MSHLSTAITNSLSGSIYMACCGKTICNGCIHAPVYDNLGNQITQKKCPFCRTPLTTTDEEVIKAIKKRVKVGDAYAIYNLGSFYREGAYGLPQD